MNIPYFAAPERLEDRIAPAGLVTVSFLNGLLTIDGSDGADHDVEIVKTGDAKFRVEGIATGINEVGNTSETYHGILKRVHIDGGAGGDHFELTKLSPLKSLNFNGNAGVDSLETRGFKISPDGRATITMGSETGSVDFGGNRTLIKGSLEMDLGGGTEVNFDSNRTLVVDDALFVGGVAADSVTLTGEKATFRHALVFNGGDGNDTFDAAGQTLKVKGNVEMTGAGATDHFEFRSQLTTFGTALNPIAVDIRLGAGTGDVEFGGESTEIFGTLNIDLGTGGGVASVLSTHTMVSQDVQFTGGDGNDSVQIDGRTRINGNFSFVGGTGDESLSIDGARFAVKGSTIMNGGSGAEASVFDLNVVDLKLAALSFTGGSSNDTVSIVADGVIAGNTSLQLGADGIAPSNVVLQSRAGVANGLLFGGLLNIDMTGVTVDFLTIANIRVAGAFVAHTGDDVSVVNISHLNGQGNVSLHTGSGADVVNVDNITTQDFHLDTGIGADELRIERNAAYAGISRILGDATILTGSGADQIRIGNSVDADNLLVAFRGQMTLDAGDGANMRNDIVASNTFAFPPTITATGGTLTETAAV